MRWALRDDLTASVDVDRDNLTGSPVGEPPTRRSGVQLSGGTQLGMRVRSSSREINSSW